MLRIIHGGADPASLRQLIALEIVGRPYAREFVDLAAFGNWETAHRRYAPGGQVPVLADGDSCFTDGAIALMYLAESNPKAALLPADPLARYRIQAMIDRLDTVLLDSVNLLGWTKNSPDDVRGAFMTRLDGIAAREKPAGWSAVWQDAEDDALRRAREKVADGMSLLESELAQDQWLCGADMSLADIAVYPLARRIPELLPDQANTIAMPKLMAWLARLSALDAVQRALSHGTEDAGRAIDYAPPR
jgi:GSH-dependent disulfide-bond oxidoreductase